MEPCLDVRRRARRGVGRLLPTVVDSMDEAFEGADVVYPKSWGPYDLMLSRVEANRARDTKRMGEIEKEALARNARHKDWICDERRMGSTRGGDALYMHCLPADIGAEVSPGVMAKHVRRGARGELEGLRRHGAPRDGEGPEPRPPAGGAVTEMETKMNELDTRVAELAARYRPLADEILKEVIRIPADYVDRPRSDGGDPSCGLSNHEKPRLEYLKKKIVEIGAVRRPEDVGYDGFGNLVWTVEDPADGVPASRKARHLLGRAHRHGQRAPLGLEERRRAAWMPTTGSSTPPTSTATSSSASWDTCRPTSEWDNLVFGRGSADQLSGVVSQIVASKILLELAPLGALRGAIVRSYGTVTEEDNDGGGPQYLVRKVLPGAPGRSSIPDAVILTEGTGDSAKGALGIYRGQRGRMQIEVTVTGKSCHGSMPWEGRNPLEFGAPIVVEAAKRYEARDGFLDHPFLGHGTRTASWARLDTPSDCAVPERFVFRFDRRLTIGETPEQAVADVANLPAVAAARAAGLNVDVTVPTYDQPTWNGFVLGNPQIYMGWVTPEEHPAVRAAVVAYRGVVTPHVRGGRTAGRAPQGAARGPLDLLDRRRRVPGAEGRRRRSRSPNGNRWVVSGAVKHPAMIGIGPGIEQNAHTIGECVDMREMVDAVALMARFPSAFVAAAG